MVALLCQWDESTCGDGTVKLSVSRCHEGMFSGQSLYECLFAIGVLRLVVSIAGCRRRGRVGGKRRHACGLHHRLVKLFH